MTRVGVILSGCGVMDGSEIHESVLMLLALDELGASYQCMAPRKPFTVIDHLTNSPSGETRDVLTESARIARGEIIDLAEVKGGDYDAFVLPGGFGAAKNLCDFAEKGADCTVDAEVRRVLTEAHDAGKPIGFACIAPAVAAGVFGESLRPELTIGRDESTAKSLEGLGATHVACAAPESHADDKNRIVSTPAYMEAKRLTEAREGIRRMCERVLDMAGATAAV